MDAVVAGLVGTGMGAGVSLLTIWIQAHYQAKRERARSVLDFAMRERALGLEHADKVVGPSMILPLAVHVHFQEGLMRLIESESLNESTLAQLHRENEELTKSIQLEKSTRIANSLAQGLADEKSRSKAVSVDRTHVG